MGHDFNKVKYSQNDVEVLRHPSGLYNPGELLMWCANWRSQSETMNVSSESSFSSSVTAVFTCEFLPVGYCFEEFTPPPG